MDTFDSIIRCIAALLHDIGKFAQRSGQPCSRDLEQEYCPGGISHRHVLYTDYFVEHTLPLPGELEPYRSKIARLASAHHRPDSDSLEETCLSDADRLSSGGDRVDGESGGTYKTARLESVFNVVSLTGAQHRDRRHRLLPIDAEDAIFPTEPDSAGKTDYPELWKSFQKALGDLPLDMGMRHYLHSLQSCLERFTWCIPSSTYHTRADISLHDHSHTTAAIAQALHTARTSGKSGNEILLVGAELSGIQKFIFAGNGESDKGAGRLLRARSFVVQMLTLSIRSVLLDRCGLESVARIMDAGGRFILLLPDTEQVSDTVASVLVDAERHLLERYGGVLRLAAAILPMPAFDLEMSRFQQRLDELNGMIAEDKMHPFGRLMQNGLSAVIPVKPEAYAEFGECVACGMRPADSGDDTALCHDCSLLINQVGRRLPTARYGLLRRSSGGYPLFGGLSLLLVESEPSSEEARACFDILNFRNRTRFTAAPVAGYIPRITEEEIRLWIAEGRFKPTDEDITPESAKTFSVLSRLACVRDSSGWRSVPFLAACKADVDNLGLLFSIGFGVEGKDRMLSISRFASLSRMMHHFFSSWLVRLVEKRFPNIYVVFAGGDDLFVIGSWSDVADFATAMREAFSRFTGYNPDVTLSAGIGMVKPKLPVLAIRRIAEEALDTAKNHSGGGRTKDAATMLGVTCHWHDFTGHLENGRTFERLCMEGKITQGFVRRILGYARECREFRAGDMRKGLYLSHMQYDMARNCNDKLN